MHAPPSGKTDFNSINLQLIKGFDAQDNKAGFFVSQRLKDRMNFSHNNAKYNLVLVPRYRRSRGGLTSEAVDSRYNITVSTKWELIEIETGVVVHKDTSTSTGAFGATRGPYGTITADSSGLQQASKALADRMIVQLATYFASESSR